MAKYTENTEPSSLKENGTCPLPMYSHGRVGEREGERPGDGELELGEAVKG